MSDEDVVTYDIEVKRPSGRWKAIYQVTEGDESQNETAEETARWWLNHHREKFADHEYRLVAIKEVREVIE